jgi:selenocysteine lyase/cysteine desulfurase
MLRGLTYLNSALGGAPPLSVTRAMQDSVAQYSKRGLVWDDSMNDISEIKAQFAILIGVSSPREIAIVPSVSAGLVAVASSLALTPKKSKVVISSLNFPANKVLWQRMKERGILKTLDFLKVDDKGEVPIEGYENAVDDSTSVVAVDFVSGFNGYVERIKEVSKIAHRHGALLVVDAFHALGALPFNAKKLGVDVMLSGFSKWMCGPPGAACLFVDEKVLDQLEPRYVGWQGIQGNIFERRARGEQLFGTPLETSEPSSSAARFEWGTWSPIAIKGVREALRFVLRSNQAARYSTIAKRKEQVYEGLHKLRMEIITPEQSIHQGSGIVAFKIKDDKEFASKLARKNVIVAANFGRIVVSPHFYNSQAEVDRFLKIASEVPL